MLIFFIGIATGFFLLYSLTANHDSVPKQESREDPRTTVLVIKDLKNDVKPSQIRIDLIKGRFLPDVVYVNPKANITFRNLWSVHVIDVFKHSDKYILIARSPKLKDGDEFSIVLIDSGEYVIRDIYFGWKGKIIVQ